jgi:hypothetical protein
VTKTNITQKSVEAGTKTVGAVKTASAIESARRLAAAGLIRPEAMQKIASMRQAILSMDKTADFASRMNAGREAFRKGILPGMRHFFFGPPKIRIGDSAYGPAQRSEMIRALKVRDGWDKLVRGIGAEGADDAARSAAAEKFLAEHEDWDEVGRLIGSHTPSAKENKLVPAVVAPAIVMGGVYGASKFDQWLENRKETSRIGDVLDAVPELRNEDEHRVQQAYDVVKSLAPSVASNPVAAGQVVKQLVNLGNLADVQTIEALTRSESNIKKSRSGGIGQPSAANLVHETLKSLVG